MQKFKNTESAQLWLEQYIVAAVSNFFSLIKVH